MVVGKAKENMRVGVTGHQKLENTDTWRWVQKELTRFLHTLSPPLIGITSLAAGADQLFARVVLQHGGLLEVVIPFSGYQSTFSNQNDRDEYYRLLKQASRADVLPGGGSYEEAYLASGKKMVDQSEMIVAVWDGKPAAGLGGTGDVVEYAMRQRKPILHIDPIRHEVSKFRVEN